MFWEVRMPRFIGRRAHGIWWDVIAVVVLAIIVVVALELTETIDLFGSTVRPLLAWA